MGADRKTYPLSVRLEGHGILPFDRYRTQVEEIVGRPLLEAPEWLRLCNTVRNYLQGLHEHAAGVPSAQFRAKAKTFARGILDAAAVWDALTPDERELLLEAGTFNHGGSAEDVDDDKLLVVGALPHLRDFAGQVILGIAHWDRPLPRAFDDFTDALRAYLLRMGTNPDERNEAAEDEDRGSLAARVAFELITAFMVEFPDAAAPFVGSTGMANYRAMHKAMKDSRRKRRNSFSPIP